MALHTRSCTTAALLCADNLRTHHLAAHSRPTTEHSSVSHCHASSASCNSHVVGRRRTFSGMQQRQRQGRQQTSAAATSGIDVTLAHPDGTTVSIDKDVFTVGSASDADLRVDNGSVDQQHAQLERKGGRVFVTALAGDPNELLSDTHSWLNDSELRHGVAYLVAPGSKLAFGSQDQHYSLQFEEVSSASPAMEMLMKGMASGGSDEVRQQMDKL